LTPPQKNILKDPEQIKILKQFPGPLNQKTNKQELLGFIQERSENITFNPSEKQLWKLLSLFVHGSDNNPNEEDFIIEILKILETKEIDSWTNENNKNQCGFIPKIRKEGDLQKDIQTLENLLTKGEIEGGCEFAMMNGLWDHALLLSSMIDKQTYQKVVIQFAQNSFVDGSPIQTLYLMFADKANLTFQKTTNFEDWRKNLSIVLANRTSSFIPIIDTMGQKLWKESRDAASSHFCFLISDFFSSKVLSQSVLLIGADHIYNQDDFISPESIQRTEIYEFLKKRKNPEFFLPKFQEYKFKYATWLYELGDPQRAFDYCQVIKETVEKNQGSFPQKFVQDLYMLDKRLASNPKLVKQNFNGQENKSGWGFWGGLDKTLTNWMHGDAEQKQPQPQQQINPSPQQQEMKPVPSQMEKEQPPQPKEMKNQIENEDQSGNSSGGWFSWLGFQKPKGNVNLGKSLNQGYVYDKSLGVWHKPGEKPDPSKPKIAPPPSMGNSTPMNQQKSSMPTPMSNQGGYVDVFNSPKSIGGGGPPMMSNNNNNMNTRGGYIDLFNTGGTNQKNVVPDDLQMNPFGMNTNLPPPTSFFSPQSMNNNNSDQSNQQQWQYPSQNYQ
jgi:hypothetical protein